MLSLDTQYIDTDETYDPNLADNQGVHPISFQLKTSYKGTVIQILANTIEVIQNQPDRHDGILFKNFNSDLHSLFIWFDEKLHIGTNIPDSDQTSFDLKASIKINCNFSDFLEQCKDVTTKASKYPLSTFTLKIKTKRIT
jgi:hypothetical protein